MNQEVWKPIPEFAGKYEASNHGRIRTLTSRRQTMLREPLIMKQRLDTNGYYKLSLWKAAKPYHFQVHKLVALAFSGVPRRGLQVHHKDRNKTNNQSNNLEWVSPKENASFRDQSAFKGYPKAPRYGGKECDVVVTPQEAKKEVWKSCTVSPDRYEVSSLGRIRCIGKRHKSGPVVPLAYPRIRKLWRSHRYVLVNIAVGAKKYKQLKVHREVAIAFIGRAKMGMQVNHKDGVKTNNRLSNLEWSTPKQNHQHASKMGFRARGERHWFSKLTPNKVLNIRALHGKISIVRIAKKFHVSRMCIHAIVARKTWRHI